MKTLPIVMAAFVAAMFIQSCTNTEKTEAITAEITAAQMEGRTAARGIINRQWPDTIELMRSMKAARSPKLRYDSTGHPDCAAAFDSAYIGTIRAVRPELEDLARKN